MFLFVFLTGFCITFGDFKRDILVKLSAIETQLKNREFGLALFLRSWFDLKTMHTGS